MGGSAKTSTQGVPCEPEPEKDATAFDVQEEKELDYDYLSSDLVSALMKANQAKVAELRLRLGDTLPVAGEDGVARLDDGMIVDDLWLLRYVLSAKGDLDLCETRAKEGLAWREEHKASLKELRAGGRLPLETRLQKHLLSGITGTLSGQEPVSVVRLGLSDCKAVLNCSSVDDVALFLTFEKEKMYALCDAATRETGRMVKALSIIDFRCFSMMSSRFDKRILSALGASSKSSSILYPQLMLKTVLVNTPSMFGLVQKALGSVMPKSSMEKMVLCPVKNSETADISLCPFSSRYDIAAAVPDFLGGRATTPIELMTPNQQVREKELKLKEMEQRERAVSEGSSGNSAATHSEYYQAQTRLDAEPFETVIIGPRSFAIIQVPVEDNDIEVRFQLKVEQHSIDFGATLNPSRFEVDNDSNAPVLPSPLSGDDIAVTVKTSQTVRPRFKLGKRVRRRSGGTNDIRTLSDDMEDPVTSSNTVRRQRSQSESTSQNLFSPGLHGPTRDVSDGEGDEKDWRSAQVFSKKRLRSSGISPRRSPANSLSLQPTLVPMRVASKEGLVKGQWSISSAGMMIFRFDNSFSKLRSKKVQFRAVVVKKSKPATSTIARLSRKFSQISQKSSVARRGLEHQTTLALLVLLLAAALTFLYFFPNASLTMKLK